MPILLAPPPPGWEFFTRVPDAPLPANCSSIVPTSLESWAFPLALLRPLAPLFAAEKVAAGEGFLTGLQAETLLGAHALPAIDKRRTPLAWVGVALRASGRRLFADVRGGCWMRGFPEIGRSRELLREAGLSNAAGWTSILSELRLPGTSESDLYFNFQYNQPAAGCDRIYVLDSAMGRLHGFALPPSALAPDWVK